LNFILALKPDELHLHPPLKKLSIDHPYVEDLLQLENLEREGREIITIIRVVDVRPECGCRNHQGAYNQVGDEHAVDSHDEQVHRLIRLPREEEVA